MAARRSSASARSAKTCEEVLSFVLDMYDELGVSFCALSVAYQALSASAECEARTPEGFSKELSAGFPCVQDSLCLLMR